MTDWPKAVVKALAKPPGARFYRCALQVNPYSYILKTGRSSIYREEHSYNEAIVEACKMNGIEAIALADHHAIQDSQRLLEHASTAGLVVFPGFEAETKDGVHLLCFFNPDTPLSSIERVLGDCGIHRNAVGQVCQYDVLEFLQRSKDWGSVCVAAHVASEKGLLSALRATSRINAWLSPYLLAASLPGPASEAPQSLRAILENKDARYKRVPPVAIINSQDVSDPEELSRPESSTWIKMSSVSVEGLRQAFLDAESRIRLASDPPPEEHSEFVALAWQGGFLDGEAIHLNDNLNVLVGGRGTGKSTIVESLRYVMALEAAAEEATRNHEGIVREVLKSGTRVSLLVRSHRPTTREYLIERTVPNPPIVRDDEGRVLPLAPTDVVPRVEVYGQHEISEIAKRPERQTRLLQRFVREDPTLERRKSELRRELKSSRTKMLEIESDLSQIRENLASLPALEETLKRFQEAGLEDRLKEQSLIVREERVLSAAEERLDPFYDFQGQIASELPIDVAFLSPAALADLPGRRTLSRLLTVLGTFETEMRRISEELEGALKQAEEDFEKVKVSWERRRQKVQADYERILRELQRSSVDGEEFIRLRRQIEDLRPMRERERLLERSLQELSSRRPSLLASWQDVRVEEFRQLQAASKRVSRQLRDRVRVEVVFEGDREPLFRLLRRIGGRLAETVDALKARDALSLQDFAGAWRVGRDELVTKYGLPSTQAQRLVESDPDLVMLVEELDLPSTATISLNVSAEGDAPVWRELRDLSTGQKATALLLLLLLESDGPLVVDQPEDDLDNRFITEGIVPKMREEKRRRQFIFATHNANIPVLGDAELIVGLTAQGEAAEGRAAIPTEWLGSIDSSSVRSLVEEVLEGGREAFEMRRLKYGF